MLLVMTRCFIYVWTIVSGTGCHARAAVEDNPNQEKVLTRLLIGVWEGLHSCCQKWQLPAINSHLKQHGGPCCGRGFLLWGPCRVGKKGWLVWRNGHEPITEHMTMSGSRFTKRHSMPLQNSRELRPLVSRTRQDTVCGLHTGLTTRSAVVKGTGGMFCALSLGIFTWGHQRKTSHWLVCFLLEREIPHRFT